MALNYTYDLNLKAYPNELTPDVADDYTVRVNTQSTPLTQDDIARSVADRLGEEPSKVQSIIQVFTEEVAAAVASGYCVSTDAFYAQPMASGVVMEEELSGPVDRDKVKVYASLRQGPAMKEALAKAKLNYFLQPAATGPYIAGMVSAYNSVGSDGVLTRVPMEGGQMAVVTGSGLKVVGTDPSVGVRLTSVSEPSTTFLIPASQISPNTPKKLQFVLPAGVTEGEWTVEVTTQYSSGRLTKSPRTFKLERPILIGSLPDDGGTDTGDGEDDGDHQLG